MVECTGLLIRRTQYYRVPRVQIPPSPLEDRDPRQSGRASGLRFWGWLRRLPVLLALVVAGCTTRTLTVTSSPSGADLVLDNVDLGPTPQTFSFRYGGLHELMLFKRGFATTVVRYDSEKLLFDQPPFDLFVDLGPWQAEDHQVVHIDMNPSPLQESWTADAEGVLQGLDERARMLRDRAREYQLGAPPVAPLLPAPGTGRGSQQGRNRLP